MHVCLRWFGSLLKVFILRHIVSHIVGLRQEMCQNKLIPPRRLSSCPFPQNSEL